MNPLKEAVLGMIRAPYMSLVSIMTISIALIILCLAGIATLSANGIMDGIRQNEEVNIYLKDTMTDSEMLAFEESVASIEGVESTRIISKVEAAVEFEKMFGRGFLSVLDDNPLPRTIAVKMSSDRLNSNKFESFIKTVSNANGIESVEYGKEWISRLDFVFLVFILIEAAVVAIIAIAGVLVISNTITLTIMARKEAIDIMRLVGATEGFIKRPFYYEGLIQGLLSGIIAFCFFMGIFIWLYNSFPELESYRFIMRIDKFSDLAVPLKIALIIPSGAILGLVGSIVAIRRIC